MRTILLSLCCVGFFVSTSGAQVTQQQVDDAFNAMVNAKADAIAARHDVEDNLDILTLAVDQDLVAFPCHQFEIYEFIDQYLSVPRDALSDYTNEHSEYGDLLLDGLDAERMGHLAIALDCYQQAEATARGMETLMLEIDWEEIVEARADLLDEITSGGPW